MLSQYFDTIKLTVKSKRIDLPVNAFNVTVKYLILQVI